jgi:purine nucleosidase
LRRDLIKNDYAVNFIVESANKYAQDLAIIAIGPLTNIALAYQYDNSLTEKISLISLMGGSTSLLGIRQFFAA